MTGIPEIHFANSKDGLFLSRFSDEITLPVFSSSLIESKMSFSFNGNTGPNTFKIVYKNPGKDALGEWIFGTILCSILYFWQYSCILLPEENAINLHLVFLAASSTDKVSAVFPDTLVVMTSVFESTVFGRWYPFTTAT